MCRAKEAESRPPVKHWKTALSIFALSASLAHAEDIRTTKGKEYKNATVSRVEPDGIVIKFQGGIVKLPFTELPSDVQKKYEYNPVAAREYAAQRDRVIPRPTATPEANLQTSEAAAAQTTYVEKLNPAEQWVVAQATAGKIADLNKEFRKEGDRQLSAHFLEDLLMGTLPDVKLHRHGVQIEGACIDEPIDLKNAQIPCLVWLVHCQFNKNVTLGGANFAGGLLLNGSSFKEGADFNSMKVGHCIFFQNAVFEGPVNFISADIVADFVAEGAKFQNKEETATFDGMKVGSRALFQDAVFEGPVHFISADIASYFDADGAKFQNKQKEVNFSNMKIRADAFFNNAVFDGSVDFGGADIAGDFVAKGAKFQNKQKEVNFNSMKVGSRALFQNAVFDGSVNFRYADFAWLNLSNASWPKVAAQFSMQGMSYKYIRAVPGPGNEPESHTALLKLANQSVYTADVYSNLEKFFLSQGYRSDADQAFIDGKRRERDQYLQERSWLRWCGSWLLDKLVGYGRRPWQAGIPCAVLVALGCVLFSPKRMEPRNPSETPRAYSRFWYSLGLFLPFVDLQADKVWKPKANQTFLRNYMRVHILLGWILVPLVLAAVTGLIK